MNLLTILITLIVAGVLLWLVNQIPMDSKIKRIINIVAVVIIIIWLLKVFNVLAFISNVRV